MKKSLLLLFIMAAAFSVAAKDDLKLKVVSSDSRLPVPDVTLTVEYPDTVISYQTDKKGRLKFKPSSFPLTMTIHAQGMMDAVIGFMSMPPKTEVVELDPDPSAPKVVPSRHVDWSSDRPRCLSSTYIVCTPSSKSR